MDKLIVYDKAQWHHGSDTFPAELGRDQAFVHTGFFLGLSAEGNAFAQAYFDFEHGKYLEDYADLFTEELPSMYHVPDTWPNYDRLRARVAERFRQWGDGRTRRKKAAGRGRKNRAG